MEFNKTGFSFIWICSSFLMLSVWALDPDCNYYQYMNPGVIYYVYNKEYPNYYQGRHECRWIGVTDPGYKVELKCDLDIPNTQGCSADRLLVSKTGNINLVNSNTYCGYGKITIQSEYNNMTIGLQTPSNTYGGRFLCNMTTVKTPPCECGWRNTRRIVGGEETGINEFPSMTGLIDVVIRDLYCGATIIAKKYALTAAHCLLNKQPTAVGLLVGDHNISSGSETGTARLMIIDRFIKHPLFDQNTNLNDIAIVVTRDPIQYNFAVGPACLPFKYFNQLFAGQNAQLLGWGTTEFTGPKSDVLLKTTVQVKNPTDCSREVQGDINQMCTFAEGHDSCQSDSGGPVLWLDEYGTYREYLIGIISTGFGCATNKPSLNTRITAYLDWIVSSTPDANYCMP